MTSSSRLLLTITTFCVLVSAVFFYKNANAAGFVFDRPLKMGISGEDVRELQKILNSDVQTMVQTSGVGSLGQETPYFGALTRAAVVRFQEKYKNDILVPNGLLFGTGFVGPSTLRVLNKLENVTQNSPNLSNSPNSPISNNQTNFSNQNNVTIPENPNKKNLDIFLAAIDTIGKKKGVSSEELERIKKQVIIDVATSTDLQRKFIETVQASISKAPQPIKNVLGDTSKYFRKMFSPQKAFATGGMPFGGAIVYTYYCACSATWLITITPLAPSFAVLLTYRPGTQAYLSYNIPFTTWLLGEYESGAGQCQIYVGTGCSSISSEGMIMPMVGSSL